MLPPEFLRIVGRIPPEWPQDMGKGWATMKVTMPEQAGVIKFGYRQTDSGEELMRVSIEDGIDSGCVTLLLERDTLSGIFLQNPAKTIETAFRCSSGAIRVRAGVWNLESGKPTPMLEYLKLGDFNQVEPGIVTSVQGEDLRLASSLAQMQAVVEPVAILGVGNGLRMSLGGKMLLEMLKAENGSRVIITGQVRSWPADIKGTHFVDYSFFESTGLIFGSEIKQNFGTSAGAVYLFGLLPKIFSGTFY